MNLFRLEFRKSLRLEIHRKCEKTETYCGLQIAYNTIEHLLFRVIAVYITMVWERRLGSSEFHPA